MGCEVAKCHWSAETSSPYYRSQFQIHIPTAETMKSRGLPQPAWVEDPSMPSWLTVRCGFKPPTLWSSRISFFKVMHTKGGYRWIQDTNWSKRAEKRMKETRKMIKVLERFWYIEILNTLLSLKKRLRDDRFIKSLIAWRRSGSKSNLCCFNERKNIQ